MASRLTINGVPVEMRTITVGISNGLTLRHDPQLEAEVQKLLDEQEAADTPLGRLTALRTEALHHADELLDGTPIGLNNAGPFLRVAEAIRREAEKVEGW